MIRTLFAAFILVNGNKKVHTKIVEDDSLQGMLASISKQFGKKVALDSKDCLIRKIANFNYSELKDVRIAMVNQILSSKSMNHFRGRKINQAMGEI